MIVLNLAKKEEQEMGGSKIGIKIGGIKFSELIEQINAWFEENAQNLQPGEEKKFSHEGEFQIPGVKGKLRMTLELSRLGT